jgi:hypothetical protein
MLVAIAASAAFGVAGAGIADVDLREGAVVARAVMFAALDAAADTRIDIHTFVHRKKPPFYRKNAALQKGVCVICP